MTCVGMHLEKGALAGSLTRSESHNHSRSLSEAQTWMTKSADSVDFTN